MGMTGAIMSFEDEIGASLNAGIMRVEVRSTPMLTPDGLIERLQAAHDLGKVSAVTMASDPSAAVRIRFARNEGGSPPAPVFRHRPQAASLAAVARRRQWLWTAAHRRGGDRPDRDADLGNRVAMA